MVNTEISNIERVKMDVEGLFWTRTDEMVEELEELDYYVEDVNGEYVVVNDGHDDDINACYILYLGHANTTIWVERVRQMQD